MATHDTVKQPDSEDMSGLDLWESTIEGFREEFEREPYPTFASIREIVRAFPEEERDDMLANLVCEFLTESWRRNDRVYIEDCIEAFRNESGEFKSLDAVSVDLIQIEFLARHRVGRAADHPSLSSYADRFSKRSDVVAQLQRLCLDDGRYVLLDRKGQGGLGCVWRAYDAHLQRYVAVKSPRSEVAGNQAVVARLSKEARMTARLDHPGIVSVHELRERESGLPFYVMPCIEGETLRRHIRAFHASSESTGQFRRGVSGRLLLEAFTNVCDAIAYAHEHGVLHGDLKPENVILGAFGEAVVLDWGLAKIESSSGRQPVSRESAKVQEIKNAKASETPQATEDLTWESDGPRGTPGYMAREQARGQVTRATDIFGLGAVLYEMLTGHAPYANRKGEVSQDVMSRVLQSDYARPREIASRVPRALEAICLKAMSEMPDDRFDSAVHVADEIRRWLADEPVKSLPENLPARCGRLIRRNIGRSLLLVLTLICILGSVAFANRNFAILANERSERAVEDTRRANQETERQSRERERLELLTQAAKVRRELTGWRAASDESLFAAASLRSGDDVTRAFAENAIGFDAHVQSELDQESIRAAFSDDDSHILFSRPNGADLVSAASGEVVQSFELPGVVGHGPIGFGPHGIPHLISMKTPWRAVISILGEEVQHHSIGSHTPIEDEKRYQDVWESLPSEVRENEIRFLESLCCATPSMSIVAMATRVPAEGDAGMFLSVVETVSGNTVGLLQREASAMALSADGDFLVVGTDSGIVEVRRSKGLELVTEFRVSPDAIRSVAIGRLGGNSRQYRNASDELKSRVLAIGDEMGRVVIWSLDDMVPLNVIRGTLHQINFARFNEDGSMLVTSSHERVQLWDTSTGRPIISLLRSDRRYDVAISSSGDRLAVPTAVPFVEGQYQSKIWQLENGKGVRLLGGLEGPMVTAVFSEDGGLVAGLNNAWQIGVWESGSSKLVALFSPPRGFTIENSCLRFSPDNRSIFFSSGTTLSQWNLASGSLSGAWALPEGLQDQIAFDGERILLFRYETQSGRGGPFQGNPPSIDPRVCRLYEINNNGTKTEIGIVDDLPLHVFHVRSTSSGRYVVVDGIDAEGVRNVAIVNGQNGELERLIPATCENQSAPPLLAENVKTVTQLAQHQPRNPQAITFSLESGEVVSELDFFGAAIDREGSVFLQSGNGEVRLRELESGSTRFEVYGQKTTKYAPAISADGRYGAWANKDGTISLCDFEQMRSRLGIIGRAW